MNGNSVSTIGMNRDDWLSLRQSYIGASDASAVLGINPWKSPVDVYLEKTGRATNNADSIDMWLGREIEPVIAKLFEQESGMKCRQDLKIRCHPEYNYLRTNLDRVVQSAPLEMKMMAKYTDIPAHYYTQIMFQAMVTNAPHVYFAVLSTSTPRSFYWSKYKRDDDLIDEMRNECVHFWETYIVGDAVPSPETARDAKGLYPISDPEKSYEADKDVKEQIASIMDLSDEIKDKKSQVDQLKASVMDKMKEAEMMTWQGIPLATWRKTKDGVRFDLKQFRAEHPKLHNKFLIDKPGYRRFNIKGEVL
jgi:putative phage-type endonuclease